MPNRIIKDSICTSKNLDLLTAEEEVFFYRLMVNCDDYGRCDATPSIIRSKCFPLRIDKISDVLILQWLSSLIRKGLVLLYQHNEQQYILLSTWAKHQQIRAKRSKYPEPNGAIPDIPTSEIICNHLIANASEIIRNHQQANAPVIQSNPIQSNPIRYYPEKLKITPIKEFDNVTMTNIEYDKLTSTLGEEKGVRHWIEKLSLYKQSSGKKYKSDYATILSWKRREEVEKNLGNTPQNIYGHMVQR